MMSLVFAFDIHSFHGKAYIGSSKPIDKLLAHAHFPVQVLHCSFFLTLSHGNSRLTGYKDIESDWTCT